MTDQQVSSKKKIAVGGAAGAALAVMALSGPVIDHFEGLRLAPYRDPVNIWTDCRGHTGPDVNPSHVNTLAECDAKFTADQRKVIITEGRCTTVAIPVESFAAFTSFGFNAGPGTYCKKFAPLVNAGKLSAACAKLSLYVYAGGQKLPGLVTRRAQERALCERGLSGG